MFQGYSSMPHLYANACRGCQISRYGFRGSTRKTFLEQTATSHKGLNNACVQREGEKDGEKTTQILGDLFVRYYTQKSFTQKCKTLRWTQPNQVKALAGEHSRSSGETAASWRRPCRRGWAGGWRRRAERGRPSPWCPAWPRSTGRRQTRTRRCASSPLQKRKRKRRDLQLV